MSRSWGVASVARCNEWRVTSEAPEGRAMSALFYFREWDKVGLVDEI